MPGVSQGLGTARGGLLSSPGAVAAEFPPTGLDKNPSGGERHSTAPQPPLGGNNAGWEAAGQDQRRTRGPGTGLSTAAHEEVTPG